MRTGFLARGLTYGVIGALAVALACGAGTAGASPDQQGALALVRRAPLGFVAVIVVAIGLFAYAVWKLIQAVRGRGPEGGGGPEVSLSEPRMAPVLSATWCCALWPCGCLAGGDVPGSSNGAPKRAAAGVLGRGPRDPGSSGSRE